MHSSLYAYRKIEAMYLWHSVMSGLQVKGAGNQDWVEVDMKQGVKAIVILNLQSYAGGRDLWGLQDHRKDKERGWKTPIFNDGLIEVRVCSSAGDLVCEKDKLKQDCCI